MFLCLSFSVVHTHLVDAIRTFKKMEMLGFLELPGWLVAIIVFIAIVCM